jgi:hypothetical protein
MNTVPVNKFTSRLAHAFHPLTTADITVSVIAQDPTHIGQNRQLYVTIPKEHL